MDAGLPLNKRVAARISERIIAWCSSVGSFSVPDGKGVKLRISELCHVACGGRMTANAFGLRYRKLWNLYEGGTPTDLSLECCCIFPA